MSEFAGRASCSNLMLFKNSNRRHLTFSQVRSVRLLCCTGVAAAFIIDKNHLLQTSDEVTAKLESDWPITMLSILNMIFCATVAARTVLKMMSTETEN